jgi:hypothetical protein
MRVCVCVWDVKGEGKAERKKEIKGAGVLFFIHSFFIYVFLFVPLFF